MLEFFKVRGSEIVRARYVDEQGNKGRVYAVLGPAQALVDAGIVTRVSTDEEDDAFLVLYNSIACAYRFDSFEAAKAHVELTVADEV